MFGRKCVGWNSTHLTMVHKDDAVLPVGQVPPGMDLPSCMQIHLSSAGFPWSIKKMMVSSILLLHRYPVPDIN